MNERLIAAEEITDEGEDHYPDPRAERGIKGKLRERHPRKPGGERDILAYHRQQPSREGAYMSMAGEENLRLVKRFMGDEKVFSIFFKDRTSPAHGDPIVEEAAEDTACDPAEYHEEYIHLALPCKVTRRRHHDLAGKGEKGRFEEHEADDPRITKMADDLHQPLY